MNIFCKFPKSIANFGKAALKEKNVSHFNEPLFSRIFNLSNKIVFTCKLELNIILRFASLSVLNLSVSKYD